MKIKKGFVVKTVGETNAIVPVGENQKNFNGLITVNEAGMFLWNLLQEETTEEALVKELLKEYDVEEEVAKQDVKEFIKKIRISGFLDD